MPNVYDSIIAEIRRLRASALFQGRKCWRVGSSPDAHFPNLTLAIQCKPDPGECFEIAGTVVEPATSTTRTLFRDGQRYHFAAGCVWDITSLSTHAGNTVQIDASDFTVCSDGPITIPIGTWAGTALFKLQGATAMVSGLDFSEADFWLRFDSAEVTRNTNALYLIDGSLSNGPTDSDLGRWRVSGSIQSFAYISTLYFSIIYSYINSCKIDIAVDLVYSGSSSNTKYLSGLYGSGLSHCDFTLDLADCSGFTETRIKAIGDAGYNRALVFHDSAVVQGSAFAATDMAFMLPRSA